MSLIRAGRGVKVCSEKHSKLVPPGEVTDADMDMYRLRIGE